jgi:hypothetical protein
MPSTYTPISQFALTSTTASITFSSIPSTYTDLVLVTNFAATTALNNGVTFNSDTGTNYSDTDLGSNGTAISSTRQSNFSYIRAGYVDTTSERAMSIVNIMNYANATTNKSVLLRWNSDSYSYARIGLWRNTAAITSITCTAVGGSFTANSTFALYGIKAV